MDDSRYMQRAIALAEKGRIGAHPNPMVGCVIVKKGHVVAEGYHRRFGHDHAEIDALKKAGTRARGATLYINLEPCSHWGKTPPCAPAVARAGLKKVVVAHRDPNPRVAGRGLRFLRSQGIRVVEGPEQQAALHLNRAFILAMRRKRPYVVLKAAMTLDGKIATANGDSRWITSPQARKLGHRLRAESDAVLVGVNTAVLDNPRLTSHGWGREPIKVLVDPRGRASKRLKIFQSGTTLVMRSAGRNRKIKPLVILKNLSEYGVNQVLLEGGGTTSWNFLEAGLVDEVYWFIAPKLLGGANAKSPLEGTGFAQVKRAKGLKHVSVSRIGPDILVHGMVG